MKVRSLASLLATLATIASASTAAGDSHWHPTAGQRVILSMSAADTLATLGTVARSAFDGRACREKSYRRLGLNREDGELYYIVRCESGADFMVRVKRDASGSTGVMSCDALRSLAAVECSELRPADYIAPR